MPEIDPTTPERLRALQSRWESDKTSRVFVQLAEEYRRLGRTEEALAILAEGLGANPNYLAAKVVLGRCHLDLGRTKDAIRELEAVIARDPTQMVAYKLLVEAHLAEGDGEEARKRLRIYSLLNDSDPEIAELRRRIGEAGRHRRDPEDTFVGALRAEPEPAPVVSEPTPDPESAAASESAPALIENLERLDEPKPEPAAIEVQVTEAPAAEPPRRRMETPAVLDELPFPELTVYPVHYRAALPAEAIFDLAPDGVPAVAEEAESEAPALDVASSEPISEISWQLEDAVIEPEPPAAPPVREDVALFDLDEVTSAQDLDVTGLLGRTSIQPEAVADPIAEPEAYFLEPEEPVPPVFEAFEEPFEPGPEALAEPTLEPAATATLAHLYLRQGHLAEAEAMFRAVIEREPDNASAQEGLVEIAALQQLEEESPAVAAAPAPEEALAAFAGELPPASGLVEDEPATTAPLSAATILAGFDEARDGAGTRARKRYLLRGYLARLRGA